VPPGDESAWSHGAFSGEVKDGFLYGRGAVDMKGGIACSVAAVLGYLAAHGGKPREDGKGSISFLITGDEEDISVNGTVKLLRWVTARGEKFDHCVLGEPSNVETLGDCIKVGRRGSLSGTLYVDGTQGHSPIATRTNGAGYHRLIALGDELRSIMASAIPAVEPPNSPRSMSETARQCDPGGGANSISASTITTRRIRCGRWSNSV
jgi:acetylornithine deacetylase/succinyl-diaminopimelate desuccinylase-like protein